MINRLDIENFKDIKSLSLNGLKQVTLISGKNNIGKTTILESLLLLFNYKTSSLLVPVLGNRLIGYPVNISFDQAVSGIFNNHDLTNRVVIKSNHDELIMKITNQAQLLVQNHSLPNNINAPTFSSGPTTQVITDGLEIKYNQNGKPCYSGISVKNSIQDNLYLPYIPSGLIPQIKMNKIAIINEFGELLKADDFVSNSTSINTFLAQQKALVREFNDIRTNYRHLIKKYLIPGLQLLDPDFEDIELGNDPLSTNQDSRIEFIKKGKSKPVPLSALGHGAKRLFSIILGAVSTRDGILLIDEIENGLHYSIIQDVWSMIFKLAKENNCQIIGTTHAWEMPSYIVNESEDNKKIFAFVNIAKSKNNELITATYDHQQFENSILNNVEVR